MTHNQRGRTENTRFGVDRRKLLKSIGVAGVGSAFVGTATADGHCDLTVDKDDSAAYDSIQKAVDGASEGATICVAPDTYNEAVAVDTADLTLVNIEKGPGRGPFPEVAPNDDSEFPIRITAEGVVVDGFVVRDGYKGLVATTGDVGNPLTGIEFRNIEAHSNANDGVTFWRVEGGTMENISAHHNGDNGIYANGPNNTVMGSEAWANGDQGIDISNDYDEGDSGDLHWGGATVKHCEAYGNENGGIELDDDEGKAHVEDCETWENDIRSDNDASGLVLNNTSSVEYVDGKFKDGIAVGGLDTDP